MVSFLYIGEGHGMWAAECRLSSEWWAANPAALVSESGGKLRCDEEPTNGRQGIWGTYTSVKDRSARKS